MTAPAVRRDEFAPLTGKAWKEAVASLSRGAAAIERVCDAHGQDGALRELRAQIERQERQHRRFAPAGYRHRLSVSAAVDYFVCRIFLQVPAPGSSIRAIAGIRADYLMGWSIVFVLLARPEAGAAFLAARATLPDLGDGPESIGYHQLVGGAS